MGLRRLARPLAVQRVVGAWPADAPGRPWARVGLPAKREDAGPACSPTPGISPPAGAFCPLSAARLSGKSADEDAGAATHGIACKASATRKALGAKFWLGVSSAVALEGFLLL